MNKVPSIVQMVSIVAFIIQLIDCTGPFKKVLDSKLIRKFFNILCFHQLCYLIHILCKKMPLTCERMNNVVEVATLITKCSYDQWVEHLTWCIIYKSCLKPVHSLNKYTLSHCRACNYASVDCLLYVWYTCSYC